MWMLGIMVGEMVKLCFEGHVYEFGGAWYLQKKGGPIGLRLSGAVAALVMIVWDG